MRYLFLVCFSAGPVFAQPTLKFEVATVKPAPPDAALNRVAQGSPDRISFEMTLRNLIYYAYGNGLSTAFRVSGGPDWINRTPYDVQGLAQGKPTRRQFRAMLRALLEERFALKIHTETQSIDVFDLVPARSDGNLGPKVEVWDGTRGGRTPPEEDDPETPRCNAVFRPPGMVPRRCPPNDKPWADRSAGSRWAVDFTAVRDQWPAKGPLKVLVVDSAQPLSEN